MSENSSTTRLSRRDFLRMSAAAAAGVTVAGLPMVPALAAPGAQSSEPVKIRIVSGQDVTEIEVRKQVAQMYKELNPNADVEIMLINGGRAESQVTMMAGGNPPDILYLNEWFQYPFMQKGVTQPLDDFVARDNYKFDNILPQAVELNRYKGQLMATPFEVATLGLVYNKKLFDEAGVPYPPTSWDDPDWTWEKLIEIAGKLTNEETKQYGLSIENWMYWSFLFQHGASVFSNTKEIGADTHAVIDSPEAAAAFQLQVDLGGKYGVSPSSAASMELGGFDRFMSGKVAMYAYGRWLNTFRTIKDFEWDVAPLPRVAGKTPATVLYTLNYAIYTGSKIQDTAWDFLKFLMTQKPQEADVASGMAVAVLEPVNQSDVYLKSTPPEHNQVYSDGLAYARPSDNLDGDFTAVLQPFLDQIHGGATEDIAGTLKEANTALNDAIEQWRQENAS